MHPHLPTERLSAQLDEAVAEVFATMLDLTCIPVDRAHVCASPQLAAPHLTASVRFSGTLTGFCALQVDAPAAAGLTAHLTGIDADALSPDLFSDTVSELCNMIAGCWKSMQPAPQASCTLWPPTVAPGPAPTSLFPQTTTRLYYFEPHHLTLALSVA